ncbi:MAG: hypothetical protein CME06_01625 [Gemmatimonadetes bacterium]|nr:hypothetical protein [Gemmatimonadota bacterium]
MLESESLILSEFAGSRRRSGCAKLAYLSSGVTDGKQWPLRKKAWLNVPTVRLSVSIREDPKMLTAQQESATRILSRERPQPLLGILISTCLGAACWTGVIVLVRALL